MAFHCYPSIKLYYHWTFQAEIMAESVIFSQNLVTFDLEL